VPRLDAKNRDGPKGEMLTETIPPRWMQMALLAALVVVLVGGVTTGTAYLLQDPTSAALPPAAVEAGSPTVAPPTAAGSAPATASGTGLDALVDDDRAAAESVVGSWVPQISAKQVGTDAGGSSYDEAAIRTEVQGAKSRYGQAVLVRSDDYTSFRRKGFWVIVVATPFPSAREANAWCDANGLGAGDCFAKRLSHTDGPGGNTVPR
jgi:hypothetical protein